MYSLYCLYNTAVATFLINQEKVLDTKRAIVKKLSKCGAVPNIEGI